MCYGYEEEFISDSEMLELMEEENEMINNHYDMANLAYNQGVNDSLLNIPFNPLNCSIIGYEDYYKAGYLRE